LLRRDCGGWRESKAGREGRTGRGVKTDEESIVLADVSADSSVVRRV